MDISKNKNGYRGYIASRPIRGQSTPQHIQNLVIRDYANKNNLLFKLSATEYAMKNCSVILEGVLNELFKLEGVILFSIFQLPLDKDYRKSIYKKFFIHDCTLHAASENLQIKNYDDISRWENIILVNKFVSEGVHYNGIY